MNTPNQTPNLASVHTIICVALSLLSAISGLAILIAVSGVMVVPVVLVLVLVAYFVNALNFPR